MDKIQKIYEQINQEVIKSPEINVRAIELKKLISFVMKYEQDRILKIIDECEVFETRQDLEQEGVEYPLINKNEIKEKVNPDVRIR